MGKGTKQSNTVTIPPEVLARYNSVNATAEKAAANPFQKYSEDPNAFVAPINNTQQGGINTIGGAKDLYKQYYDVAGGNLISDLGGIDRAQAQGQEYLGAATGLTGQAVGAGQGYNDAATNYAVAGGQSVDPTALGAAQIGQFFDPYINGVVGSTVANLRQQQGQDASSLVGDQIRANAFGGSRSGLARAQLAKQQEMGTSQVVSGLLSGAYGQALGAAQQQQGVGLGAAQANRAATQSTADRLAGLGQQEYSQLLGAGQQYAGLGQQGYAQGLGAAQANAGIAGQIAGMGNQAQQNELAQGQAQLAAGTAQQQTEQAGKTALFDQFQQERAYPFQTAQFLANIAEGTGALSGNTTSSTGSSGFFSDERLKEDSEVIGKTFDGQNIYKFRYKGSPHKQIGLMAQDVEKHHPDAVGLARGYKTVNYDEATKDAADKGHYKRGGLVPQAYKRYANGGLSFEPSLYPYGADSASGVGGGTGPRGIPLLPQHEFKMLQPTILHNNQSSGLHELANASNDVSNLVDQGTAIYDFAQKHLKDKPFTPESLKSREDNIFDMEKPDIEAPDVPDVEISDYNRGGLVPRGRYAFGGLPYTEGVGAGYVPDNTDNKTEGTKSAQGGEGGSGPKSGLGAIAGVAKDIGAIAGLASLFSRGGLAGGRKGYATDGAVDDDQLARAAELQDEINREPPPDLGDDQPVAKRPEPIPARHPPENMPVERGLAPKPQASTPPEEKDGNWFDRNRNWLIPALKGLGTAAASNSRSPIGALLQGAGVAAGAYGDIEKQQAETANIRANKPLIEANVTGKQIANRGAGIENARKAMYMTPFGNFVFVGNGVPMPYYDYLKLANEGKAPALMGAPQDADARIGALMHGLTSGQKSDAASSQDSAPAKEETSQQQPPQQPQQQPPAIQQPPAPKYLPSGVGYDDQSRAAAEEERKLSYNGGTGFENAKKMTDAYRGNVFNENTIARQNALPLKELATTIADSNKLGGIEVAGSGDKFRSDLVRVANTLSRSMGGEQIGSFDEIHDKLGKLSTMLGQQAAMLGNQESNASLNMLTGVNPNMLQNPDAAADLAAGLLVMNRRATDREEHMQAYNNNSNGLLARASDDFERVNNNAQYTRDRQILSHLIRNDPDAFKAAMSGQLSRAELSRAAKVFFPNSRRAAETFTRYFSARD